MPVTDAYEHVFDDVREFPKHLTIDLAARYAAAFGMRAAGSVIDKVFVKQEKTGQYEIESYPGTTMDFERTKLEIKGADIEPLIFNDVLKGKSNNVFAGPLFLTFGQKKSLIETKVNDDDPVVIERWGTAPWSITMSGLLIDLENRIYPTDEIRRLNTFWQQNKVVNTVGQQFEELDIDSVVLKSIQFKRVEGIQDTIKFTFKAKSIKSVNFTLLKPNA